MILPPQATSWGPGGPGGQPGPAVFPGENLPENICRMKNIYREKGNAKQKGSSRFHFFSRRPNPARFPPALAVPGHLLDHFLRGLHQRLTFRFRNLGVSRLLPFFEGFGFSVGEFGLGKQVSVSVSENLVSEKNYGIGKKSPGIGVGQDFGIVIQWTALRSLYLFVINIVKKGHPARRPDEHGRNLVDWEGDGVQADRARGGKDGMITKAEQAFIFHTLIFLISCSKSASNSVLWC